MTMRKTLMLTEANYKVVSDMAIKTKAPRHLVLDALIEVADERQVIAKLQQLRAGNKANKIEDRKKRQMLADLTKDLPADDLAALIASIKSTKV